jgi:2-(1,2-epoxy-1,2-dihydrophenyl)acetyl-CoA isomerase
MNQALLDVLRALEHDRAAEIVVLRGRGPDLCAGGDPGGMAANLNETTAPPMSLRRTKALLHSSADNDLETQLAAEMESFAACRATQDYVEAITAFTQKRAPNFIGA